MNDVHYSSSSVEWETPAGIFLRLESEYGPFTLDPCATIASAKAPKFYTVEDDGLEQSWANERVFMNPPYGRHIGDWIAKARNSARDEGATVVGLIPAKTETAWWHDYIMDQAHVVRFVRGRLHFDGASQSGHNAPFPSAVVIWLPVHCSGTHFSTIERN